MNKSQRHNNSQQPTPKNRKNNSAKQNQTVSTRTPQDKARRLENKNGGNVQKFKSIPNLTYRDLEPSSLPTDHLAYHSHFRNQIQSSLAHHESQQKLMMSMSYRNNSTSKMSFSSKVPKSSKSKKTMITSKYKNNDYSVNSKNEEELDFIYNRTKTVLENYKNRENAWKHQKGLLLKEIQKYKRKIKERKDSTTIQNKSKLKR